MNAFDRQLFELINASSTDWGVTATLAYLAAKYLFFIVLVHLAMLWILGDRSVRRQALALLLALVVAITVSGLIGQLMPTERPFQIPLGHQLIEHRPSASFPSNHALVVFTYAAMLALLRHWRYAAVFAVVGVIVGWARIYLGIHFPLDVAGAAMVGPLAAAVAFALMRRFAGMVLALADAAYAFLVLQPLSKLIALARSWSQSTARMASVRAPRSRNA
ncbi:undecaprenyl-diphosphatase [Mangrovicella endophytica]|uniref:undecaprenyl-diphosphatase n=1 Tax=Mangrovicella endophytica TaxID=2066697 RepID=UPI000C9DBDF4|nr:undecaprenyl-diphosphatase [Mangrovicella endophytica]